MIRIMRRSFRTIVLTCCFALALFPAAGARAANGTISGQILGRNGAANIGRMTVNLEIATAAGGTPQSLTTTASDDGSFRFEGFTYNQNAVYLLRVAYDGGNYFREVEFPAGQATVDVGGIEVYPSTRDASVLSVPRLNTIFSTFDQNNGAQGIETGAYTNSSDRAYVGQQGGQTAITFRFGLPQSATGMQPAQGLNRDTLVSLDEPPLSGFASLDVVTPGEHQFAFIYRITTRGDSLDFDRVFPYPTGLYTIYLPVKARLASGGTTVGLRDSGEQTLQNGQKFRVFTANNIPAGGRLTARFSGLPSPSNELNPLLLPMLIFVLLIGIGLIVVYGRRRGPLATSAAARHQVRTVPANAAKPRANGASNGAGARKVSDVPASTEELAARKETLLIELVELDDRHDNGDLPDDEYRRLRRVRKQELVTTLRALGDTGGANAADPVARENSRRRS